MQSSVAVRRQRCRRIADENRKRAAQACYRCKARKSKCIRTDSGICQRCIKNNWTCQFEKERTPPQPREVQQSPQVTASTMNTQNTTSPEQVISIDSHQTESILWPRFLSTIREAFSLDPQPGLEEQEMVAMQAVSHRITRPTILQPAERTRLQQAIEFFPPKPVADFLLSVLIKHGVDIFFYFDQAQLLNELDQFYSRPTSPLRSDPSFVCLALAVFALGSHWTPLEKPDEGNGLYNGESDPGRVFYDQVKILIPDIIDLSCLRSIQTFFVLGVYMMPLNAVGSSYIYIGMALRKALAFDLHLNADDQIIDEREKEVRRRLWWSIYALERCATVKLNRPRSVSADIITVALPSPLPSLDAGQKFDNVQFQIAFARLVKILDVIADSGIYSTDIPRPTQSKKIEDELRSWKNSLPKSFDLETIHPKDSRFRAVFHIYLNYYYAWIAMGKFSLVTVTRMRLRYYLGQELEPPRIDDEVDKLSKACAKAARKLLQLFEHLTRTGNTAQFSFTDFQGCSIATIVTLISGILERDSTYENRAAFGMSCLRRMSVGSLTAKIGYKFVEALKSIADEAAQKVRRSEKFPDTSPGTEVPLPPSAYNEWAEWLANQEHGTTHQHDGASATNSMSELVPSTSTRQQMWPISSVGGEAEWSPTDEHMLQPVPDVDPLMQQPLLGQHAGLQEGDLASSLYNGDQTFLIGLTGLDVLDLSNYTGSLL